MRHLPAWLLVTATLFTTAAPLRAGGPAACPAVPEGTWTRWLAPVTADWGGDDDPQQSYRRQANADDTRRYGVTIDPWNPCVAYRIGTPGETFADRGVVQRSTDRGRTWHDIRRDDSAQYTRVYVPAPNEVDLTGPSILRSRDGGGTWSDAGPGTAAPDVYSLTVAPPGAPPGQRYEYAVTLPCHETTDSDPVNCTPQPGQDMHFVGKVAFWTKAPGRAWRRETALPDPSLARSEFAVRAVAEDPAKAYVYDKVYGTVSTTPPRVLVWTGSGFDRQQTAGTSTEDAQYQVCRRGSTLLMLAYSRGVDQLSAGLPVSFRDITDLTGLTPTPTTFGPDCSLFQVRSVMTGSGNGVGHDVRAVWSPTTWSEKTYADPGRFPSALPDHGPGLGHRVDGLSAWLPPDGAYQFEATQVDTNGVYYVTVGRECHTKGIGQEWEVRQRSGCGGTDPGTGVYEWVTWAYRVPADRSRWREVRPDGGPASVSCQVPAACGTLGTGSSCALRGSVGPGSGLGFDGRDLLYPVDAERQYAVRFDRVDPATCTSARDPVLIELPPDQLTWARRLTTRYQGDEHGIGKPTLDARFPDADTVTYDPVGHDLYFSLRDNAPDSSEPTLEGNPASVWVSHDLRTAELLYVGDRCLRDDPGSASGMDLLSFDRVTGTLLTCADARPLPVGRDGLPLTPDCLYHGTYRSRFHGWAVSSWTYTEDGRALVLVDSGSSANVVKYRPATCGAEGAFTASAIASAKGVARYAQLACTPPAVSGRQSLLWYRRGAALTPYAVTEDAHWCRTDTHIDVTTSPTQTCATVTGARLQASDVAWPLADRDVRFTLDGVPVDAPPTDATGRTCVRGSARTDARAAFAGDHRFRPSAGTWPPVPVVVPRQRPVVTLPPVPRQPVVPEPPYAPLVLAPQPVPVLQPPPPPPAPPGANVAGLSENREENQQLAYVGQDAGQHDTDQEVEELAIVALMTAAATAVAWRRRAAEAVAPVRR